MSKQSKKINSNIPAIKVEKCTVRFNDNIVLDNISFEVPEGKIVALLGPNGSGKTTLLKAILGLIPLNSGKIKLFNKHIHQMRGNIGYVPQRFQFDIHFPITVLEFMNINKEKGCPCNVIEDKILEIGLDKSILNMPLGRLSGGQLQRVLIAQAVMNDPEILFLDEPSAGIDLVGEQTFYGIIDDLNKKHGTTVVLVSHDIAVVTAHADQVVCINKRLLCKGTPTASLSDKTLSELYDHHIRIHEHS